MRTTRTVYRLSCNTPECAIGVSNGVTIYKGPYAPHHGGCAWGSSETKNLRDSLYDDVDCVDRHPSPYEDIPAYSFYSSPRLMFGFSSAAALNRWFYKSFRRAVSPTLTVHSYLVNPGKILPGSHQLAFYYSAVDSEIFDLPKSLTL